MYLVYVKLTMKYFNCQHKKTDISAKYERI